MPAVSSQQAITRGLALHTLQFTSDLANRSRAGVKTYILYLAEQLISDVNNEIEYDPTIVDRSKNWCDNSLPSLIEITVFGIITVSTESTHAYNASEVVASAAETGYGPLMYDIAMSLDGPLISDRGSVSKKADQVWKRYMLRSDVKHRRIDDYQDPQTPPKTDDDKVYADESRPELDQAFSMNDDKFPEFKKLIENDKNAINSLLSIIGATEKEIESAFDAAALSFFETRYF